uniref:Protein kinase domain-containing protein n=1 Tax=Amphilophus citrinellus TaxID=61819 RepID=A0A3Q0S3W0_AMPCI
LNKSENTSSFLPSDFDNFKGTMLGKFYKVEALLGEGCFGFVPKCLDTKTNKSVAMKVNKNHPEILQQAKSEIFILEQLRCLDPDSCNIIKWNGFFIDREHVCLNFELLDQSLYDYIQDRNYQGLPVSELRPILYQLANAPSHLSSRGIAHTDLKPDNVMIVDRNQSPIKVKVIDFGLACPVSTLAPHVSVQSLWYRVPDSCGAGRRAAALPWSNGSMVVWWLALLPHSKNVLLSNPPSGHGPSVWRLQMVVCFSVLAL